MKTWKEMKKKMKKMKNNYNLVIEDRKKLVEKIIENIKKRGYIFEKNWDPAILAPQNPVSNLYYLGGNHLRLINQAIEHNYKDPRWMTFKQAASKGWSVKKGEKGTLCEKWIFEKEVEEINEKTGEKERVNIALEKPIANYFYVFNGEQIKGLPELNLPKVKKDELFKISEDIIKASECPVKELAQTKAFYNLTKDEIILPLKESFKDNEGYVATALHEMIHSTGHPERLKRNLSGKFGSSDYAKEELVAELGSIFLQGKLGIKLGERNLENHQAYLQSWMKVLKQDANELFRASVLAEKATNRIFTRYLEQKKELNIEQKELKEFIKTKGEKIESEKDLKEILKNKLVVFDTTKGTESGEIVAINKKTAVLIEKEENKTTVFKANMNKKIWNMAKEITNLSSLKQQKEQQLQR